ncbi:hypothetical protein PVAG01_10383 [Phlyctema vagabunda]|uniref:SWIM-type domain-containing protein n=1 Tax=Phlyctema vagabunda TaxID=108571 RepID=A0ABR4P5S1_9HELO
MTSLPSPRIFLTNLLNTLSTIPAPPTDDITTTTTTNPLKNLRSQHRALLSTLHVLFPPPMLLQSLDLLDRHLVTRLIPGPPASESPGGKSIVVYQIRSSQQPRSRFNHGVSSSTNTPVYTVRLRAWNCTCAAFTFSAFPGSSAAFTPELVHGDGVPEVTRAGDDEGSWEFGGLSSDGSNSDENLPCCKHLLACLLAEKWEAVLGAYVNVREISLDEMAGVAGEN